jgi:hypothetical protein
MGWKAGTENDSDNVEEPAAPTAAEEPEAGAPQSDTPPGAAGARKPQRGVYVILAGLVVTGVVAGWKWLKGLPK